jgi:hypothetical protein
LSLRQGIALSVTLAGVCIASTAASASPVLVQTDGVFVSYSGPVGAPINGPPAGVDPAYGPSRFGNGGAVEIDVSPQNPYAGYPWPEFAGAGTATQALAGGWDAVEFWNQFVGGGGEAHNRLDITGTTTPNVAIGDLFHIATLSFTNGDWFSSEPPFDPGNGPLYPVSEVSFVVTATANPATGTEPHIWADTLRLVSTRGAGTPDNLFLTNHPQLGGLAIPEATTGSVEVWGRLGSLQPVEFRNPTNASLIPAAIPEAPMVLKLLTGMTLAPLLQAWRVRRGRRKT